MTGHPARWWHPLDDGRIQCDLCPRECRLRDGQRGFCFVRQREGGGMVLDTYGRSSGYCVDPVEKKPLWHFLPGTGALSFGTAGCNLHLANDGEDQRGCPVPARPRSCHGGRAAARAPRVGPIGHVG